MKHGNNLKDLIYVVRGVQVMLDADLALIYGYTTRTFNQQVKNNIEKFDDDFRFQLTKDEYHEILKSKDTAIERNINLYNTNDENNQDNLISKKLTSNWGGTRKLPYAFTEQGIYMLMTVLKGEMAIKQSKALIRTFKEMKDFLVDNRYIIGGGELLRLSIQNSKNTNDIAEIKEIMVTKAELAKVIQNFSNIEIRREHLILNGKAVEANMAYSDIYKTAKRTIHIIDNYIGIKTLALLKDVRCNVEITIFSDNIGHGLHQCDYNDFHKQYPNIKILLRKTCGIYHDRYIIVDYKSEDERIYHCGSSSKDAGNKVMSITEVYDCQVYHQIIDTLSNNPILPL